MLVGGVRHSSHQSQTWVRVPTLGWRIVSTHLSVPTAVLHAEAPSATLGAVVARTLVPLPPNAHRPAVTNLEGTAHTTGSP
jgi:hypothetical protein